MNKKNQQAAMASSHKPHQAFGAAEIEFKTTEKDRSVIWKPMLTPHFSNWQIDASIVILVSEGFNAALQGKLYLDLMPLLDGSRTREELSAALSDKYTPLQIQTALVSMASKHYIVSSEFQMGMEMAAFWAMLGASPCWAEERLRETPVRLVGQDEGLETALADMGISLVDDKEALTVVATHDFASSGHADINRQQIASGTPWILVKSVGVEPLFGPVFQPEKEGPCWACLAHRFLGNREVESFLRHTQSDGKIPIPSATSPAFSQGMRRLAATNIAKWIVLGELAQVDKHVLSSDPVRMTIEHHPVMRRPQCPECGDEKLYNPDREPKPVVLKPSRKPIANSGGLRSVPPEETVRKYRHLVSPISGVVTELQRTTDAQDPWLHVFWAGSNLALKSENLRILRSSLRTKSAGKGSTSEQAEASALCEAIERYSGVYHGDEIRIRKRFVDFADGEAIPPNALQLYSDWQYDHAEEINARGGRFAYVPRRFDPTAELNWTPVWSLTQQRYRYILTAQMFYAMPDDHGNVFAGPDSNGSAAGNTLEEAILQGFFELAERDAFACWWYNRVQLPEVDLESFNTPWLSDAKNYYESYNRSLWVLDATHDLGIPVFIAVSGRTDKAAEDIVFSAGAHFDPKIACFRAVCELNQYLSAVRDVGEDNVYFYDDPECQWWWRNATMEKMAYLAPDRSAAMRRLKNYPVVETSDLLDDVKRCQKLVEDIGMEFLVYDYTRPDVGMPVAKTIVPGLRHFWARYGKGRLYDVPVTMGWLDAPTPESELNPIAVFI